MNNLKNEIEIEGYVDKLSSSPGIDKYGYEYITFILHYPRGNKKTITSGAELLIAKNSSRRCKVLKVDSL